jgi:hypothetical protein
MLTISGKKKYALVVNGEFACELKYPSQGNNDVEKTTAILQSNPKVVFISEEVNSYNISTYNLIIDDEVVDKFRYINSGNAIPDPQMVNAALKSDPTIVDITDIDYNPEPGWKWDGTVFLNPES